MRLISINTINFLMNGQCFQSVREHLELKVSFSKIETLAYILST